MGKLLVAILINQSKIKSIVDANDMLSDVGFGKANIPTLVFRDIKDRIFNHDKMQELVSSELNQWTIFDVSTEELQNQAHYISRKKHMENGEWSKIEETVRTFLNK